MFDRRGIYHRFASCYSTDSSGDLARKIGIARQTAHGWKAGRYQVAWIRLKEVADLQAINWDWLLEGKGHKQSTRAKRKYVRPFDMKGINQRYLSLFAHDTQANLARLFDVSQVTVHKWQHGIEQVSWKKLKQATEKHGVTWEWLIEGQK